MANSRVIPAPHGDEAELFRSYNPTLMQKVASAVHTRDPQTVEDACAFAWAKFLECQPDRNRNWNGWIFTTAQRQAWLLERERVEHASLPADDQISASARSHEAAVFDTVQRQ